jgi:uncharacterized membrane protein
MKYIQGSIGQILLLLLALGGIGISIYLTIIHYEHIPPVCSNTGLVDCARVLSSEYSVVPGTSIPITVPGLGWCLVSAGLAVLGLRLVIQPYWLRLAQLLWSLAAIAAVLYLIYAELVRLHTICLWCTILHVIIVIMFLITLVRLPQPVAELELEPEAETLEPEKPLASTSPDQ